VIVDRSDTRHVDRALCEDDPDDFIKVVMKHVPDAARTKIDKITCQGLACDAVC